MRIAIANWSNRIAGGAESYISSISSFLTKQGHEVSLWHECDYPANRPSFPDDLFAKKSCLAKVGPDAWVDSLRQWRPDVIYVQDLRDPQHEDCILGLAPTVFFVHNYNATCISGRKSHVFPVIRACSQRFGPVCVARFYPNRCGGLNPLTMIRDYQRVKSRLKVVGRYDRVLTHSRHVQDEYRRNGIRCDAIPFFAPQVSEEARNDLKLPVEEWRLIMAGRMDELKGGRVLLEALPDVARALPAKIRLRLVGDGASRKAWEEIAARLRHQVQNLTIEFTGWLSGNALAEAIRGSHLHVLPSLWPEPYGLSGLELGLQGVPTVAFRVGGIPDWLEQGVNGILADYSGNYSASLGRAIVASLGEEATYLKLCTGARDVARRMTIDKHGDRLLDVFRSLQVNRPTAVTVGQAG
jgi:glycosyltransferase involved in cell wall biosynthesis